MWAVGLDMRDLWKRCVTGSALRLAYELVGVPLILIRNSVVLLKSEKEVEANESGFRSSIYDL